MFLCFHKRAGYNGHRGWSKKQCTARPSKTQVCTSVCRLFKPFLHDLVCCSRQVLLGCRHACSALLRYAACMTSHIGLRRAALRCAALRCAALCYAVLHYAILSGSRGTLQADRTDMQKTLRQLHSTAQPNLGYHACVQNRCVRCYAVLKSWYAAGRCYRHAKDIGAIAQQHGISWATMCCACVQKHCVLCYALSCCAEVLAYCRQSVHTCRRSWRHGTAAQCPMLWYTQRDCVLCLLCYALLC